MLAAEREGVVYFLFFFFPPCLPSFFCPLLSLALYLSCLCISLLSFFLRRSSLLSIFSLFFVSSIRVPLPSHFSLFLISCAPPSLLSFLLPSYFCSHPLTSLLSLRPSDSSLSAYLDTSSFSLLMFLHSFLFFLFLPCAPPLLLFLYILYVFFYLPLRHAQGRVSPKGGTNGHKRVKGS